MIYCRQIIYGSKNITVPIKKREGIHMKKRITSIVMSALLLSLFPGCQQNAGEPENQTGLWKGDELELYLSQFGVPLEQVKENLGLSEDDLTEGNYGEWNLTEKREIEGMDFFQSLTVFPEGSDYDQRGYDWQDFDCNNTLYRMDLVYYEKADADTSIDQLWEKALDFALQAKEVYGEPSTYPGLGSRLFDGDGNLKREKASSGREEWHVSEDVTAELSIYCDDEVLSLRFTYVPDIVRDFATYNRLRRTSSL